MLSSGSRAHLEVASLPLASTAARAMPVFQLQDRQGESLSDIAKTAISRAKTSWLKNTEVVDLLINHQKYHLPVSSDPPNKPAGERPLFAPTKGLKEVDRINLPCKYCLTPPVQSVVEFFFLPKICKVEVICPL